MLKSIGREPRFRITFGSGGALPLSEGQIDLNRFTEAGTFEVSIPLAATGKTLGEITSIGKTDVRIEGSNDGSSAFKAMLLGVLDRINVRASASDQAGGGGVMVVFRGRDNTAKLIDQQRTQISPTRPRPRS